MTSTSRTPTHPGQVLLAEFLAPMVMPQAELAKKLGVPVQRIKAIVNGKRGITPKTAWLFADAFGTSPQFWMNLQVNYDLANARLSTRRTNRKQARADLANPPTPTAGGHPE